MPTIPQLPPTSQVYPADEIPLSQDGTTRTTTVGRLLASTQPAILAPTGTLLGRVSLGPGGPEPLIVGAGLQLANSSLAANGTDHAGFDLQNTLQPTDELVLNSGGNPKRMTLGLLRGLFAAGTNITIDPSGTISGTLTSSAITGLGQVSAIAANDLIGISQGGTDHSISYANLLNGQTIDAAQPALAVSDADSFWAAQGSSTMLRQGFSAVWNWVTTKLPAYKLPIVELTANTTLNGTAHNGRILICSSPVTLTPAFINMGSGFHCEVINLSAGAVTFGTGIVTSSGSSSLPAGQCANLRAATYSAGNIIFATLSGTAGTLLAPGQVTGLSAGTITPTSIAATWTAPAAGGAPATYTVQYRVAGATVWINASTAVTGTSFVLTGLAAATSYNIQILAVNASGPGPASSILTANTLATALVSSITWNLAPSGPYARSVGSIGVNVHVNPATATVQFGFSTSATVQPASWVTGSFVNTDLWAAYVSTPATAGIWYAWAKGMDGSAPTVYATGFTVT